MCMVCGVIDGGQGVWEILEPESTLTVTTDGRRTIMSVVGVGKDYTREVRVRPEGSGEDRTWLLLGIYHWDDTGRSGGWMPLHIGGAKHGQVALVYMDVTPGSVPTAGSLVIDELEIVRQGRVVHPWRPPTR
jgi:hypothetical protein